MSIQGAQRHLEFARLISTHRGGPGADWKVDQQRIQSAEIQAFVEAVEALEPLLRLITGVERIAARWRRR